MNILLTQSNMEIGKKSKLKDKDYINYYSKSQNMNFQSVLRQVTANSIEKGPMNIDGSVNNDSPDSKGDSIERLIEKKLNKICQN